MKFNWLPWKFIIRVAARTHGFLDPIVLLGHISKFSQPSEVAEPIELLRAGVVFHARGLINSRVIQHNLDWVWPYWIECQFDPTDDAFVPRAFSLTHVNLTHRNWTAIGIPNCEALPIVDPRGLLTPFWDKWSLDTWILTDKKLELLPSRMKTVQQDLVINNGLAVKTKAVNNGQSLITIADVTNTRGKLICNLSIEADSESPAWIVVSLRPYNPEGISFIYDLELSDGGKKCSVDKTSAILFDEPVERFHASTYRDGDVYIHLNDTGDQSSSHCDVGMVTAAALFKLNAKVPRKINVQIPLENNDVKLYRREKNIHSLPSWDNCLEKKCQLQIPEKHYQKLYETAIRTLVLCSPDEAYPGPYTYKRFWYRDAAFIVYGLLCAGLIDRAEQVLKNFPKHQDRSGYFHSQQGEWDSNGEVLWILKRFHELTKRLPDSINWWPIIRKGANWIIKKRLPENGSSLHAGMLPAGFSAEHLGPNDYYYWDDFWSIGGLQSATSFAKYFNKEKDHKKYQDQTISLSNAVNTSLKKVADGIGTVAMTASPYRRLDAGAIGSLAAGYPLQLFTMRDARLLQTVEFLLDQCFVDNGFFQDMIHSGINPYLTLHVAEVLLRASDKRFTKLIDKVAKLASPTGQWPEAVHPQTLGGCMGDGQHAWAAAEWIIILRNCFVREEKNYLVLCSGIPSEWLHESNELYFGPAYTSFGRIKIWVKPIAEKIIVRWEYDWHEKPEKIVVQLFEHLSATTSSSSNSVELFPEKNKL